MPNSRRIADSQSVSRWSVLKRQFILLSDSFASAPGTAALLRATKRGVDVRLLADENCNTSEDRNGIEAPERFGREPESSYFEMPSILIERRSIRLHADRAGSDPPPPPAYPCQ